MFLLRDTRKKEKHDIEQFKDFNNEIQHTKRHGDSSESSSLSCTSLPTTWYKKGHRNSFTLPKDFLEISFPKKHLTANNIIKSIQAGHPCSIKSCVRHDHRSTTAPDNRLCVKHHWHLCLE